MEYAAKLLDLGWSELAVIAWLARLQLLGNPVEILWFHLWVYPRTWTILPFCSARSTAERAIW